VNATVVAVCNEVVDPINGKHLLSNKTLQQVVHLLEKDQPWNSSPNIMLGTFTLGKLILKGDKPSAIDKIRQEK
jgi:hypothetical protein